MTREELKIQLSLLLLKEQTWNGSTDSARDPEKLLNELLKLRVYSENRLFKVVSVCWGFGSIYLDSLEK